MDLSQYSLLDDFRLTAHWWLPSRPEDKVPGTLTFNPDAGARQELMGLFNSPDFGTFALLSSPRSLRLDIVLGSDADADLYTLHILDALNISNTSTFRVSYLLAGKHFSSTEEINFRSALVQYTYLEAWSCFQFTRPRKSDSPECLSIDIPSTVATLFAANPGGLIKEVSLEAYARSQFKPSVVDIRPGARFKIELSAASDLRAFLALLFDLGQLMTMFVGNPSYVKKLGLFDQSESAVIVFFSSTIRPEEQLHPLQMCFPLKDIHSSIRILVEKWFESVPLLKPIHDLLFGTLFAQDSFVTTKFLSLTQALESFHRRTTGGTYVDSADYLALQRTLTAAVPASIPNPLRQRLSDTLTYANEYSLRKRLNDLFASLDVRTVDMLKIPDLKSMVELIVKTRNYLTHFDEESRTLLVDDIVRMHYMNVRLTALQFILILKRLGIGEAVAASGVVKRRYFE